MLKIIAIKTSAGYYISDIASRTMYQPTQLASLFINGEIPYPTFSKDWVFVKDTVQTVAREDRVKIKDDKFVLKDETLADRFVGAYNHDDVVDIEGKYIPSFEGIRSLYKYVDAEYTTQQTAIEFTFEVLDEIEEIPNSNFSYKTVKAGLITKSSVNHNTIDKIITPAILLETKPCNLSSKESYDIVRAYVRENINLKVARITSDYDFCFEVEKLIGLDKPYEECIERLVGRKRKKEKVFIKSRSVKVFEMTYSPENYARYTPIEGFKGNNLEDLRKNIDTYLENLISMINQPLTDCPSCDGQGVITCTL